MNGGPYRHPYRCHYRSHHQCPGQLNGAGTHGAVSSIVMTAYVHQGVLTSTATAEMTGASPLALPIVPTGVVDIRCGPTEAIQTPQMST